MDEKITLEELMTKRVLLTPKEYSNLMFYLERCVDCYEMMRAENPEYKSCDDKYKPEQREIDVRDLGRVCGWSSMASSTCGKIFGKAHADKNVVGSSKHYPELTYTPEEGLLERTADGKIVKAEPFELML